MGAYGILISSNKEGHVKGVKGKGMKYEIKDVFEDGKGCCIKVNNAIERNDHIVIAGNERGVIACLYRPIYKNGKKGKRTVVTFNPLTICHDGDIRLKSIRMTKENK